MRQKKIIILIFILAFILRLINLNQSFWLDEAAQVLESARPIGKQFDLASDFHPPLYHVILHFWMYLGKSEIWIRLLSIVFGLGSIYFIYKIAKFLFDNNIAILSAFLVAISPYHIWYSQEARPYMLFVFASLASTYFFLNNKWTFYIVFSILSFYSLYFAPFLIFSHLILALIYKRNLLKEIFISLALIILSFIFWLPNFLVQLNTGINGIFTGWTDIVSTSSLRLLPSIISKFIWGRTGFEYKSAYLLILLPAVSIFLYSLFISQKSKQGRMTLILFFIPIISSFTISFFLPVVAPQRLLFILPLFSLISAIGLNYHKNLTKKILLTILLVTSVSGLLYYYLSPNAQREQWRQAVNQIESENETQNSIALFVFPDPFAPYIWYSQGKVPGIGIAKSFILQSTDLNFLGQEIENKDRIYLFQYLTGLTDPKEKARRYIINKEFKEGIVKNFPGVGLIFVYDRI